MSAKVHLHMHVSDLGKSRDFYERFLGESPVKVKTGYVKFLPAWGPVNLALSQGEGPGGGPVDHLAHRTSNPGCHARAEVSGPHDLEEVREVLERRRRSIREKAIHQK